MLPLLLIGSTSALAELATSDVPAAATAIEATHTVLVPDITTAANVLRQLGFSDELAEDRLTMARTGHTRLAG